MAAPSVKARNPYWDNIKGILIFLVVLGHFLWPYWGIGLAGYVVCFIYLFHMPAFVFVSGFLSRSENARSSSAILRLAMTYAMFNTAMMLVSHFLYGTAFQLITPYYSYWYLLSLIVWRLTIGFLHNAKGIGAISIVAAIAVGFWSDVTNVLAISRTIAFFPFFLLGYRLAGRDANLADRKPRDHLTGVLVLLFTISLSVMVIHKFPFIDQSDVLMYGYTSPLGPLVRVLVFCIAALMIMGIAVLVPRRPLPLFCDWGRNSLAIYVLHRFVTLAFERWFPTQRYREVYVLYAVLATVCTVFALGQDSVSRTVGRIISVFDNAHQKPLVRRFLVLLLVASLLLPMAGNVITIVDALVGKHETGVDVVYPVMSKEMKRAIDHSVSIAFVGDLILLQDQVRDAYSGSGDGYGFAPVFQYAAKYLKEADLAIGVFEGPMAGESAGYSTSNYNDGLPLRLNYPDSFASAVKEAGIDLVSTANNHLLDCGLEGAWRTLDVLDRVGLLHVGSYRNAHDKASFLIVDVKGIRIAFLAYAYGSNGYSEEFFFDGDHSVTSALAAPGSKYFETAKASVLEDFKRLKEVATPPDLIVVMPHMGTQFSHQVDDYQRTWNDIFVEAGADIILGDHAHAVQPVQFRGAVIVNCPGNFANSYTKYDGDATSIVELYIDPASRDVIGAAVVPMYTHSTYGGQYRALPVHSILTDPDLQNDISRYEMQRVAEVQETVTSVMLGARLTLDQSQERYFLFPEGYVRQPVSAIDMTEDMKMSHLYSLLSRAKSVCFAGDSITAGSRNGGYGWYEPLMAAFPDIAVTREAWGSATSVTLLENAESVADHRCDLYVVAIGTNDVRYRDDRTCAMDSESFTDNIDSLVAIVLARNPQAKFALISPWLAQYNDPYTALSVDDRDRLLGEYAEALRVYCEEKDFCFVNPNPAIHQALTRHPPSRYLLDHIHPNARDGIRLYSEKVLADIN